MNIFVLCTGRCGSLTFAQACQHMTNYSAGHETNVRAVGADRLRYPRNHVEVDARLVWFLGALDNRYGASARYVHLVRDTDDTAESFLRRWGMGIIRAWHLGVFLGANGETTRRDVCRSYVKNVNANIHRFLQGEQYHPPLTVHLENARSDFARFWERVGAKGDLDVALAEWDTRYNASI